MGRSPREFSTENATGGDSIGVRDSTFLSVGALTSRNIALSKWLRVSPCGYTGPPDCLLHPTGVSRN